MFGNIYSLEAEFEGIANAVWEIKIEEGILRCNYQGLYATIKAKVNTFSDNISDTRNTENSNNSPKKIYYMMVFHMSLNWIKRSNMLLIFTILFINIGCADNNIKKRGLIMNTTPLNKQFTNTIDITAPIPVIVYFNDIKISEENTPLNTVLDVNAYTLKNGKHKVRVQILPIFRRGDTMVKPEDIKGCLLKFGSYIRDVANNNILDYKLDTDLQINVPKQSVPFFEQEWEVEINNLPYELEGWSNGQDLSKIDREELEKKVLDFHKNTWDILNRGDSEQWLKLTSNRFNELKVYNYLYDYKQALDKIKIDIEKYAKNTMIPLEDYEMKLYANGKLVTLERKSHTKEFNNQSPLDLKGWGGLISKGKISGAADYRILLYLPQGSDEFVIIRK